MILMSDTGGGHRASAEALQAGFEQLYGDEYKVSCGQDSHAFFSDVRDSISYGADCLPTSASSRPQ